VLEYPNWSIKDVAVIRFQGKYFVFFSAFYLDNGEIRCHVVEVTTRTFKKGSFSAPILNLNGAEGGWGGMCSPSILRIGNTFYLTYNSWGDLPGKVNQLFYRTSKNLVNWSAERRLAQLRTAGKRAIDAALAYEFQTVHLIWKQGQNTSTKPRRAVGIIRNGDFLYFPAQDAMFPEFFGTTNSQVENYQFLNIDGMWKMLATYTGTGDGGVHGHNPYLYDLDADLGWDWWNLVGRLDVPMQSFNTMDLANAGFLLDLRHIDSYYYLFYAGNTEKESYLGRGWNKLGIARSTDLITWTPLPEP
jgi:hypothetical protein